MIIRPDQTTRDKINEIECYLSYLLRHYLLLTSFLFSPFFTFFTGQRHLKSNIFEINFSSRKSQSAFFSFGTCIKVVKLVANHFFVSFSCSLGSPSVDQSHSKYLVATADESDLNKTRACWLKPKESPATEGLAWLFVYPTMKRRQRRFSGKINCSRSKEQTLNRNFYSPRKAKNFLITNSLSLICLRYSEFFLWLTNNFRR